MNQILIFLNTTAIVYLILWIMATLTRKLTEGYEDVEFAGWADPAAGLAVIWIVSWIIA